VSGRHAVVKPRRVRLTLLLVHARVVWRAARAAGATVGDWRRQAAARLRDRWENRDLFADEPAASATSLDPIPAALPAPVEALARKPLRLTPNDAAATLHAEHPHLPWQVLEWRLGDDVHGQVRSLDCGPDRMRAVVSLYAEALGVAPREDKADEGRVVLTATGEYAGVLFIVSAVFIAEDTIPLRVYAEAAVDETLDDTLTTQAIPEKVLAEVLGK
jgi:hypothetical protein